MTGQTRLHEADDEEGVRVLGLLVAVTEAVVHVAFIGILALMSAATALFAVYVIWRTRG